MAQPKNAAHDDRDIKPLSGKAVLSVTETAYYCNLTELLVRKFVQEGRIPYRKLGSKLVFLLSELDAWIATWPGLTLQALLEAQAHQPTPRPQHITLDLTSDAAPVPEVEVPLVRGPQRPKIPYPGKQGAQG